MPEGGELFDRGSTADNPAAGAYLDQHRQRLELAVSNALQAAVDERPDDPVDFVASRLAQTTRVVDSPELVASSSSAENVANASSAINVLRSQQATQLAMMERMNETIQELRAGGSSGGGGGSDSDHAKQLQEMEARLRYAEGKVAEAVAAQQAAVAAQMDQLEDLHAAQKELMARDEELSRLRLKSQDEEETMRRKVVHDISSKWGGISKVIESALVENAVHSPAVARVLQHAQSRSREVTEKTKETPGDEDSCFSSTKPPKWNGAEWVNSLGVGKLVADVLLATSGADQLAFMYALAEEEEHAKNAILAVHRQPGIKTRDRKPIPIAYRMPTFIARSQRLWLDCTRSIAQLLRVDLIGKLTDRLWDGLIQLVHGKAETGAALHAKFVAEGDTFKLSYGGLDVFFGGLESLVSRARV